ncbi:LPXTG cell wall anchor domain-containing protein, partial [Streptococcus pacificus]
GVTVKRVDKNGTEVTAKYTPTVEKVTPTGEDATSTGKQGQVQTATPVFTAGDPLVPMDDAVPATFEDGSTEMTIDGEGTYTVAPDGTVTFTPVPSFTGTGTGVIVKRVDKNGTAVTAKFVPMVEDVIPTGVDATSTGKYGEPQVGKPVFTAGDPLVPMDDDVPATFEDGSTEMTIYGEGTYTVAPDGTVTFIPEKGFTGLGTGVTIKRVDKNGTVVTAKFIPTVENYTLHLDTNGNPLIPDEDGNLPGYEILEKIVDEKGNITYIYKKVVSVTPKHYENNENTLPRTGESDKVFLPQALLSMMLGIVLFITSKKSKKEEK